MGLSVSQDHIHKRDFLLPNMVNKKIMRQIIK